MPIHLWPERPEPIAVPRLALTPHDVLVFVLDPAIRVEDCGSIAAQIREQLPGQKFLVFPCDVRITVLTLPSGEETS